jgi:ABC-2 type transport system ATP-binding protein
MRGKLTAALLHDPEVLYLDEPTIGLDVVAKARIREVLMHLNRERGVTVLLTTHDMGDVERLCRRVLVLDRGRLVYDGEIDALKHRFGTERTVVVDLEEPAPPLEVPGARVVKVEGPRQWLRFHRAEATAAEIVAAVAARARLVDLTVEEPAVEDVIRHIYEHGAAASPSGAAP